MDFITGYMDDAKYRHLLNDMTGEIFGFSFKKWYDAGFFEGEYIPYSYIENNQIIANASANIMKFAYNGKEKLYIQIGTVMTRPAYRNRGLARDLIGRILRDYEDIVDGFYLFGNLQAVDFYKRIGFKRLDQWKWYWDHPVKRDSRLGGFLPAGEQMRTKYVQMLKNTTYNAVFDHINRCSLQMFYTMDMEDVYYCEEINCFTVMHIEDHVLCLDSVITDHQLAMEDIASRIDGEYTGIAFGFVPKNHGTFRAEPFDGDDDYRFFYFGEELKCIEEEQLYFPVMSHA